MIGLMIRDLFSLRKKIYLMGITLFGGDLLLVIVTALLRKFQHKSHLLYALRIQRMFKGGVMLVSFAAIMVVFLMVSIVVTDRKSRWNKMLTAFPVSGIEKGMARYLAFFIISFVGGVLQLALTMAMFNILKYDFIFGSIKYVYCPFAIGLLFVYVRMICEYLTDTAMALEYTAILAFLIVAGSVIIYKFGGIDFPVVKAQIIKIYMAAFDKWMIPIIPCVMALGIFVANDKMVKPKMERK